MPVENLQAEEIPEGGQDGGRSPATKIDPRRAVILEMVDVVRVQLEFEIPTAGFEEMNRKGP